MLKTISLSCLGISLNATSAKSERINDLTISEEAKNLVRTILTPTLSGTTPVAIEKQSWFEGLQANWDTWKKKVKVETENLLAENQYQQDLAVYSDLLKKAKSANKNSKKILWDRHLSSHLHQTLMKVLLYLVIKASKALLMNVLAWTVIFGPKN